MTKPQGEAYDTDIEPEAPVLQIVKITFHPLVNRCIASPSVYLGPSGNADLKAMASVVMRDLFEKFVNKEWALRPRPDNTHVALQDIKELRQFVQAALSQERADKGASRIVLLPSTPYRCL